MSEHIESPLVCMVTLASPRNEINLAGFGSFVSIVSSVKSSLGRFHVVVGESDARM